MNTLVSYLRSPLTQARATSLPLAARTILGMLDEIKGGRLQVRLPDHQVLILGSGDLRAELDVHHLRVFERALGEGDIGFGEAYIDGDWDSPDPAALLTLLAENRAVLKKAVHGRWWSVLRHRLRHLARSNTRAGSKRNILAHYDLGNDFYKLWLDSSMTYSSALFGEGGNHATGLSLDQAQQAKYLRLLDRLDPKPGDTILEIGCGWGGFAEIAVRYYGCRVHGITLSPSQLAFAQERAVTGGWADHAEFSLTDYRDLHLNQRRYDHVVSIEMFEAVGERFWPGYFRQIKRLLKPGGRAAIQTITIADDQFRSYRRGTDFIQRHIFPGGMLPSPSVFARRAASADFHVADRHAFGPDYARTLAAWHTRFEEVWPLVQRQGFDERFHRLWRFYLAYCEAGFQAGTTDVYQFLLEHRSK